MAVTSVQAEPLRPRWLPVVKGWGWALAVVGAAVVGLFLAASFEWLRVYPKAYELPLARWLSDFMRWLTSTASFSVFTVQDATLAVAALLEAPFDVVRSLLATGFRTGPQADAAVVFPPLAWFSIIALAALSALWARGLRLALLVVLSLTLVVAVGQWQPAMVTLSSIVVAVPLAVAIGFFVGVACFERPWLARVITPLLDLMQTVPAFAYLVPILLLFGFGPAAAIVATIIYAVPPMIRLTILGVRSVPVELVELGDMVGADQRQKTWKILLPVALPNLMVGVNQVIMMALNISIIAAMIGAGGLGFEVLTALRKLDFGAGLEAGFSIVALAIVLDRLSQAAADRVLTRTGGSLPGRLLPLALLGVVLLTVLGWVFPSMQYPEFLRVSTSSFWAGVIEWVNVNYFDELEAVRNVVVLNLLMPLKRAALELPWAVVAGVLSVIAARLGGWRMGLLVALLTTFIAVTGQWEKAMITVYLCGISTVVALVVGIPIGVWAAETPKVWPLVRVTMDTLQTLPSFVYLIPAVMLFRVGDFTAMLAVVAYAVAPAVRYTAHGIQSVRPDLIETGRAVGASPMQILTRIKIKLALPHILLGVNQTIMMALSMLVITALVGTRDLGQEIYIALAKADTGRGLVAGLAVAFIAIIADRMVTASSQRMKTKLGLS